MIELPITYTNPITDREVTKTFYFGLTRVEALRLNNEWQDWGGLEGRYDALIASGEDVKFIMDTIEELILRSYGVRVGDEIEKSESLRNQFAASEAYSELFTNLLTSDDPKWDANEFIKGIIPKKLRLQAEAEGAFDEQEETLSRSEQVRRASEARMQGRKQKQQSNGAKRVDLPVREEAAEDDAPEDSEEFKKAERKRKLQAELEALED
jgi:hypothetical protein